MQYSVSADTLEQAAEISSSLGALEPGTSIGQYEVVSSESICAGDGCPVSVSVVYSLWLAVSLLLTVCR